MKVRALKEFNDLQSSKLRKIGEEFEATEKRVEEINSTQYGALVVVIETNKEENKVVVEEKATKKKSTKKVGE